MRMELLFPLAFVSGVDGFLIFAPYLIVIIAISHVWQARREALSAPQLATASD